MAKKVDLNQSEIVLALRAAGATVQDLHELGRGVPDLLVGHRGVTYLLEVKGPGGKLTPAESAWFETWRGQAAIVDSAESALAAIGALEIV